MCTSPTANATLNLSSLSSNCVCRPPSWFSASFHGYVHNFVFALSPSFYLFPVPSLIFDFVPVLAAMFLTCMAFQHSGHVPLAHLHSGR